MSDELDRMFECLRGQRPPAPFAFPEAVRRRGRQRTQHQVLAAGLAVAAVAGAGAGWVVNLGPVNPPTGGALSSAPPSSTRPAPSASPTSPATRTPAPTTTDLGALTLRPVDLGPGTWQQRPPDEPFSGDRWYWDRSGTCPAYRTADYPSLREQAAVEMTGWWTGRAEFYVYQHVHRYQPGWGPRALNDVGRFLATCADSSTPRERFTVLARRFAGDEALLVRQEAWPAGSAKPLVTLIAVVRVGDLVATVYMPADRGEQYARTVAEAAANRLAG